MSFSTYLPSRIGVRPSFARVGGRRKVAAREAAMTAAVLTRPQIAETVGARINIDDPAAFFAEPERRAELRALADARLAVHVTLGGPLPAQAMGTMAAELGCSAQRLEPRPGSLEGFPYIAVFRAEAKEDDGRPRTPAWIETAHFDGDSAYSIQALFAGRPLAANRFVDMRAVYRDLPTELKALVTGRNALHGHLPPTNQPMSEARPLDEARARRLPLVIAHPKTGEPVLRPPRSSESGVEGLPLDEAREVLADLWARVDASPHAFEARLTPGTMLIWEGVATTHTNPAFARADGRHSWFATAPGKWTGFEMYRK
jgi:hypothetical protein